MTMQVRTLRAVFLRAWLFTGILAVIAGIFGMHVMSTGHSAHASARHAAVGHTEPGHPAVGHSDPGHADPGHPAGHAAVGHSLPAESCGAACPSVHESGASCTPSATAGSLTVLPPSGTAAVHPGPAAVHLQASDYSYIPPGPTPCELSISRT